MNAANQIIHFAGVCCSELSVLGVMSDVFLPPNVTLNVVLQVFGIICVFTRPIHLLREIVPQRRNDFVILSMTFLKVDGEWVGRAE